MHVFSLNEDPQRDFKKKLYICLLTNENITRIKL